MKYWVNELKERIRFTKIYEVKQDWVSHHVFGYQDYMVIEVYYKCLKNELTDLSASVINDLINTYVLSEFDVDYQTHNTSSEYISYATRNYEAAKKFNQTLCAISNYNPDEVYLSETVDMWKKFMPVSIIDALEINAKTSATGTAGTDSQENESSTTENNSILPIIIVTLLALLWILDE